MFNAVARLQKLGINKMHYAPIPQGKFWTMSKNGGKFGSSVISATTFNYDMSLWLHCDEYDCTNRQNKSKQVQEHFVQEQPN